MSKIGLVIEGGGMKCAYSAAVLDKFLDDNINFDYVIGVSAGSANGISFVSRQRGRARRFYIDYINDARYLGFKSLFKTGDIFGLDYIYSTLTNSGGVDPLDYDAFVQNPAEFVAVATNANTGKAKYFYKKDFKRDNYEIIKASCALPGGCRPRIINGVPYFDGGLADAIPCNRALKDGCGKIVVITSKPRDFVKKPESFSSFVALRCRKYPKVVDEVKRRHIYYPKNMKRAYDLEKEGRAFIIAPSRHFSLKTISLDRDGEFDLYNMGLEDYETQKSKLNDFLKK